MVQLGAHHGRGPASLAEIAQAEDLPRAYLEQLVMSLRDAGLVRSTRGARGGYELARDPALIKMSDVLRALEGPHRADGLRERGPGARNGVRSDGPLHRQRPVGPDPRRDHGHAREHDPRRPGAADRRDCRNIDRRRNPRPSH